MKRNSHNSKKIKKSSNVGFNFFKDSSPIIIFSVALVFNIFRYLFEAFKYIEIPQIKIVRLAVNSVFLLVSVFLIYGISKKNVLAKLVYLNLFVTSFFVNTYLFLAWFNVSKILFSVYIVEALLVVWGLINIFRNKKYN